MSLIVDRFFTEVSANSTEKKEYTPANNVSLTVGAAWGESGNSPDTTVCIMWDAGGENKLIYATHTSGHDTLVNTTVTGNGTKKLSINLINNSDTVVALGGGWSE